jgi:hypothetical protein
MGNFSSHAPTRRNLAEFSILMALLALLIGGVAAGDGV